jgi:hypothetical protein
MIKNAIHLKTRDVVFNKNTGGAITDASVDKGVTGSCPVFMYSKSTDFEPEIELSHSLSRLPAITFLSF